MTESASLNTALAIMTWWACLMQFFSAVVLYYRQQPIEPWINIVAGAGFLGLATRFTFLFVERGGVPIPWWSSASLLLICLATIALAGHRTTRLH